MPLFVEELTKAVLETGGQGSADLFSVPHPTLSVPANSHASLMARLDRLGRPPGMLRKPGAAIGGEFGLRAADASTTDLAEPQLHEALDRLTSAGLLFVAARFPNSSYVFKHVLVQDAAYGTLLRAGAELLQ